jgi:class 3 adenylate cyclase
VAEGRAELRLVTCLFIDIVSSTELTVSLGPERMRRLVDEAFAAMSALIVARGGTIEKFVGDAIFVLFGAPVSHADDSERALRAADECARWAREHAATTRVAVRIGVESGEALVDLEATEGTRQRMAVGACVNLAARLQALAEPGQILVGPSCRAATEYVAEFAAARRVAPKGLDAVETWPLVRIARSDRGSLPFVGRVPELELLRNAYGAAREGRARLALVIGPPGQGKTRLVSEVVASLRAETTVLEARCRPGEESGSETPLRQLLASDIGEPSAEKIALRVNELLKASEDSALVASAIAHSVALALDPRASAMPRLEQRELLTSAWRRYLEALAVSRPVVLWIEDIHWADALVLRLIDRASADVASRLLVLATARPEFAGSAHFRPSDERIEIELGPLGQAESVALARSASAVEESAVRRAEGNPLFIVELARARLSSADVPVSVQAVIGARLDELPSADRGLLQHASVVGDAFTVRDAALLSDREPAEVAAALGRLSHLRFIEPVGTAYRFHHALVHDVAYGRLAAEERLRLHVRYAREGLHPGDVEALAHHWWEAVGSPDAEWVWADAVERAAMRREALAAHLAAASRLIERNAQERALEVSKRAVSLADDVAGVASAEAALGTAFARTAQGDDAWIHRNRAREAYRRAGTPPPSLYADMLEIPTYNFGYFRELPPNEEVTRLLEEGISVAREARDDLALARLLAMRAVLEQDVSARLESRRLIRTATDRAAYAEALARQAQVEILVGGDIDVATELFDEAMARAAAGMPINEPEAIAWHTALAFHAGKLDLARSLADRLIQLSPPLSVHTQTHALGCRALVLFGAGDWDLLRSVAREIEQLVDANPDASFCLVGAAGIGHAAAGAMLLGRGPSARLGELVDRMVKQPLPVRASIRMLPEAMAGNAEMVMTARDAYSDSVQRFGRQVWDRFGVQLAISLVILGRWGDVDPLLATFDQHARHGGQMLGALSAAIREEGVAANGGPRPTHRELRDLGYRGLSELLSFRAPRA